MVDLHQLSKNLEQGNAAGVEALTSQALDGNVSTEEILDALIGGMAVVGRRFKTHEIFLPEVLLAAKAMNAGMDMLKPFMIKEGIPLVGRVVLGTVQGDLHDIGKNLVGIMLRGAGFDVVDLGRDVPAERFVQTAEETQAQVIGMSALLTTTMPIMEQVVNLAREREMYGSVKVIVGGAPVSAEYARRIGAHAYGFDGVNAVEGVKKLLGVS